MFGQVVSLVADVFGNITVWFMVVLESAGMYTYYVVVIFLLLLARFILAPLFGAATRIGASDTVRRIKTDQRINRIMRDKQKRSK